MTQQTSERVQDRLAFPDAGFVGVGARFAELYSEYYESPKEFLYFDFLVLLGNVLSGRVRANFGGLVTQPRLYGIKVAVSGWRRKSTSTKIAKRFIQRALTLAKTQSDPLAFTDVQAGVDLSEEWAFILPGAGSAEGLAEALAEHNRVTVVFDELRRFEKKANIEGSVLISMIGELFDSNEYSNPTKGNTLKIDDGHLSFLSNTTEENFQSMVNASEMLDIGFLNRFLIVVSNKRRRVPKPIEPPEERLQPILDELARLFANLPQSETVYELTAEAERVWTEFYMELPETEETTRLDNIGMRLMSLFTFMLGKNIVDEAVVRSVLAVLGYQLEIRIAYKPNEGLTPDAKLESAILAQVRQRGPMTKNEIRRFVHADRYGTKVFDGALSRLNGSRIRPVTVEQKPSGPKVIKYELVADKA